MNPPAIPACEFAAGDLRSEDLAAIAIAALAAGVDSPTLGELAAQSRSDVRDPVDLFRVVLDELGIALPERGQASWTRIRTTATGMVDGEGLRFHRSRRAMRRGGRALVARLQSTLGPGHHVEYTPEPIRPPGVRLRRERPGLRRALRTAGRSALRQQGARGPSGP